MSNASTPFWAAKPLKAKSTVFDLKERLDWGEPALTIIDTRDRDAFNESRITGAISIPVVELVSRVSETLERDRDIYVYGEDDEKTAAAAGQLREAGYEKVAELMGGVAAWKAAQGAVEGVTAVSA